MFSHEMKEKEETVITLKDISPLDLVQCWTTFIMVT